MILLQDSMPYSTGKAESFFDGKSSTFSSQIKKLTDSEEEIICHNLNVEEIWKRRLIGASLRLSHDQNRFAEGYSLSITPYVRE